MLFGGLLQKRTVPITLFGIILCLLLGESATIAQSEQITPDQIYHVLKKTDPTVVVWKITEQGKYNYFREQDSATVEGLRTCIQKGKFIEIRRARTTGVGVVRSSIGRESVFNH